MIINPNNPTGALYPKEVLQQIVDVAREHQLIIFSDEIYDRLVMDDAEQSPSHPWRPTSSASPQRSVQIAHDRRLPHRMDDLKRQQARGKRLHRRAEDALQHAALLQRAGPSPSYRLHSADTRACAATLRRADGFVNSVTTFTKRSPTSPASAP